MFKSIINYFSSGVINQVTTLFFWIVVAKYISPEMLGEAHEYLLYVDLAVVFSIFGADSVIYKYYFSDKIKAEIFSASMVVSLIGYLIFILLCIFLIFFNLVEFNKYLFVFLIIHVFLNVCVNLIYADKISQKHSKEYLDLNIIRAVVFLILAYLFFSFSDSQFPLQLTYICTFFIIVFLNKGFFLKKIYFRKEEFFEILNYAFPFMLYGISGIIHAYLNRLFALNLLSTATFSIFVYFYVFYAAVESLLSNLNKTWTPFIFSKFKTRSLGVIEVMLFASSVLIAFYSIFLFLFSFIVESGFIKYFLQDLYLRNISNLFMLLLAPIFLVYFFSLNPFLTYSVNSKKLFLVNALKVLFLSIVSYLLISRYLLIGATISVITSSLFQLLLFIAFYRKNIRLSPQFLLTILFSVLIVFLNFFLLYKTNFSTYFRISLLLHLLPMIILSCNKYFSKPLHENLGI